MSDEGFFSRWSRRKSNAGRGDPPEPEAKAVADSRTDAPGQSKP